MIALSRLGIFIVTLGACVLIWGISSWVVVKPTAIKSDVNPLDLIQLGLTLIVGFYLTQYLAERTSERKAEKEILIRNVYDALSAAQSAFEALEETATSGAERRTAPLLRRVKALGVKLVSLRDLLTHCGAAEQFQEQLKTIDDARARFWRAATNTNPPSVGERALADRAYQDLSRALAKLVIDINRVTY